MIRNSFSLEETRYNGRQGEVHPPMRLRAALVHNFKIAQIPVQILNAAGTWRSGWKLRRPCSRSRLTAQGKGAKLVLLAVISMSGQGGRACVQDGMGAFRRQVMALPTFLV